MRIIKNFALNSNFSINCIALTNDSTFLALGDANKIITIFPFYQLESLIKRTINFNQDISSRPKFQIYNQTNNLPKLILDYHNDSINALVFSKLNKYFLISGASDKCLIIWKIIPEGFTYEKMKVIKTQSDVTDLSILPNDEFVFAGCVDNNIYIWRSNLLTNTFELVNCINNFHNNFITSICLDPSILKINHSEINNHITNNGIKFASYSDDGRLILAEAFFTNQGIKTNLIKDFKEFINVKNKINQIQKKIDWSIDGNWIVSVNHHYIKNHKVVHARLVNMNDLGNPQILIGHDSAVLVAKFSPVKYSDKEGQNFSLLATSDKNGNLIIWKISNSTQFKILTEIENLSESNITYLLWSNDGNFLFASNSYGSVYILEFNEFFKSMVIIPPSNENISKVSFSTNPVIQPHLQENQVKRRIAPELITTSSQVQPIQNSFVTSTKIVQDTNLNPNQLIQECPKCQKQKLDLLENKIVFLKLESFENKNLCYQWENKIYDNYCTVQLRMNNNKILYANKFENKLIRLFTGNNYYYAFYDVNSCLCVLTLFNSLDITFLESYTNFLLYVTGDNKLTLLDIHTKEKISENYLEINSLCTSSITTKISTIKFINLDKIVLYVDTFNVFKNSNTKKVLIYNRHLNVLTQIDNNSEADNIINFAIQQNKFIKSPYDLHMNDHKLLVFIEERNLINENDEKALTENYKIQSELKCLEEKILFYHELNQKNEFIFFMGKYLFTLGKFNVFYKIIDFFNFYFKFNDKKFFSILEEKRDNILGELIKENILNSEAISNDFKFYLQKMN